MDQILGKAGQGVLKLLIRNKKGYRPTCAEQYALSSSKGGIITINQSINHYQPIILYHGQWWSILTTHCLHLRQ